MLIAFGVAGELYVGAKMAKLENRIRNTTETLVALIDQETEQLRKQNIALQTKLAQVQRLAGPRFLSPDEQLRLVEALSKYKVGRVLIASKIGDTEAIRFGDDFILVFSRAGWEYRRGWFDPRRLFFDQSGKRIDLPPSGITIPVENLSNPPPMAKALKSALKQIGFPAKLVHYHYDDADFHIWIGHSK